MNPVISREYVEKNYIKKTELNKFVKSELKEIEESPLRDISEYQGMRCVYLAIQNIFLEGIDE